MGRVSGWIVEVGLVYLILAFPSGRLTERVDRLLIAAGIALVVILYLPSALLTDGFPVPSPYTSCDAGCPQNAFLVPGSEPGFVDSFLLPLRELLTVLLFAAVTGRLAQRVHRATPVMRRTLSPVLVVAASTFAILGVAVVVRRASPDSAAADALSWMVAFFVPAMAVAFLVGLVRWRFFVSDALQGLALRLRGNSSGEEVRTALADAFGDPSLELAYPVGGGGPAWVDAQGLPVSMPTADSDRQRDGDPRGRPGRSR